MSREQAEAKGARIMDERIAVGEPYVFLGAASAITGPYDDIVLPARGETHDWELELAAVIGIGGRHIPRDEALSHVAGYTIANDLTTRDLVYRPDLKAIGSDWLRAKNAPTFLPLGPWIVPGAVRRGPAGPDDHAERRRRVDAERVDRGHDLRRSDACQLCVVACDAEARGRDPHRLARW